MELRFGCAIVIPYVVTYVVSYVNTHVIAKKIHDQKYVNHKSHKQIQKHNTFGEGSVFA